MNKGFVASGLAILTFGFLVFWYLLYNGLISSANSHFSTLLLIWGISGSVGLILTFMGTVTNRRSTTRMPARICIHCGCSINLNQKECPYCGQALVSVTTPSEREKKRREKKPSLAYEIGKLMGKHS